MFLFIALAVSFTVVDSSFYLKIIFRLLPSTDFEAYTLTKKRLPCNNPFPYFKAKLNPTIQHNCCTRLGIFCHDFFPSSSNMQTNSSPLDPIVLSTLLKCCSLPGVYMDHIEKLSPKLIFFYLKGKEFEVMKYALNTTAKDHTVSKVDYLRCFD